VRGGGKEGEKIETRRKCNNKAVNHVTPHTFSATFDNGKPVLTATNLPVEAPEPWAPTLVT
jgi:hypothetical protein